LESIAACWEATKQTENTDETLDFRLRTPVQRELQISRGNNTVPQNQQEKLPNFRQLLFLNFFFFVCTSTTVAVMKAMKAMNVNRMFGSLKRKRKQTVAGLQGIN
jgi:hypothetical protein